MFKSIKKTSILIKIELRKYYSKIFLFFFFFFLIIAIFASAKQLNESVDTSPRDEYWKSELQDEIINIDMYLSVDLIFLSTLSMNILK